MGAGSVQQDCPTHLCRLPDDFSTRTLQGKLDAVQACHEQDVQTYAQCAARHHELGTWVADRIVKPK